MKLQLEYKRNVHQLEFHSDLTTKLLHLSTGFGGGKSYALVMKLLQLSAVNKYCDGGLVCPTYGDFKKDMLPIFEDILDGNRVKWNYHKSDHYFSFPWTKRKLWVASGENKLRGPNWGYAGANEVTLMPIVRYKEIMGRVRDKRTTIPQIVTVGTPEGTDSDYYEFFIEKPPVDPRLSTRIIYGDTRDNAENLDPGYIAMLEASYDRVMIDAYLRGLWVNMKGNRFYYAFNKEVNEDRSIVYVPELEVHCFLDFNVQYMTATLWQKERLPFGGERIRGFDEIVIENNADTYKMIESLQVRGYLPRNTTIYPDPAGRARKTSGKADHQILKDAGYTVVAKSAAPRMRERQLNVNNLLDKGYIIFNPDRMPFLRRDLQAVEQNPDTLDKNKKNEKLTHASDGLDYGCDILFPFSGKREKSAIIKFR